MTARAWGIALAVVSAPAAGCTNLNYQKAWKVPVPQEVVTDTGTAVAITDQRPRWERKPFRDAMSLYGMGDIAPPPWEQLRDAVAAVVGESPERPERVEVVVRSVQLVVKDSNRVAEEAERRHVFHNEPAEDCGLWASLASVLIGVPLEILLNAPLEKRYPADLWNAPEGTSCRIRADVTVAWSDGRKKTIPVSALSTTARPGEPGEPRDGLNEAVRLAMFQVQDQLRRGLGP